MNDNLQCYRISGNHIKHFTIGAMALQLVMENYKNDDTNNRTNKKFGVIGINNNARNIDIRQDSQQK